ncbi:MAG: hypothetical protein MJZ13_00185 [Bacteroidales bacterium]|nr:hypothetical protein [Bacteroidales bacterium]
MLVRLHNFDISRISSVMNVLFTKTPHIICPTYNYLSHGRTARINITIVKAMSVNHSVDLIGNNAIIASCGRGYFIY